VWWFGRTKNAKLPPLVLTRSGDMGISQPNGTPAYIAHSIAMFM